MARVFFTRSNESLVKTSANAQRPSFLRPVSLCVRASAPAAARRPLLCPRAPLRGATGGTLTLEIRVFETGTVLLLALHPREIYHAWRCRCTSCSSRPHANLPAICLPLPFVYEPVSWLKKAQTSCVDLFSIGSKQKCIAFCKYASYLPAKSKAGAYSPLAAAKVGQSLQQRDRRSEPRSSSAPKSRLQRRPRLAPPSNSPSAAPSVRSVR